MKENKIWKSGSFITAYILIGIILLMALPSLLLMPFPEKRLEIFNEHIQQQGLFEDLEGFYIGKALPKDEVLYEMGLEWVDWMKQEYTHPDMHLIFDDLVFYDANRGMGIIFDRYPTNTDEFRLVGVVLHRKSYSIGAKLSWMLLGSLSVKIIPDEEHDGYNYIHLRLRSKEVVSMDDIVY